LCAKTESRSRMVKSRWICTHSSADTEMSIHKIFAFKFSYDLNESWLNTHHFQKGLICLTILFFIQTLHTLCVCAYGATFVIK
jgi:hypothetical protein